MTARTSLRPSQLRARETRRDYINAKIAKVKIAIKQLDMDDSTYRTMLERVTGNRSLTLCIEPEIDSVLLELERLGFQPSKPRADTSHRKLDDSPDGKLIRAIWLQLHAIGEVKNPSEAALGAYVLRVGKVSAIQWLTPSKITIVVETLKKWAVRVFPQKLAALWNELHAQGKRPAYTPAALDHFITRTAGRNQPYTYDNLLACYKQLKAELERSHAS